MISPDDHRRLRTLRAFGAAFRDLRTRRRRLLARAAMIGGCIALLGGTLAVPPVPRLVWNASASAPRGLYLVSPGAPIAAGDMVVARLPQSFRPLAARRHYLPANVPLVKRVAAVAGDEICASGDAILVNGRQVAIRRGRDGKGRALPRWRGCQRLKGQQLFLLMDRPDSFDGRYFGITERADVIGKARLIWPG